MFSIFVAVITAIAHHSYVKNVYHSDIMQFLLPAGRDGMRVCRLTRNIYNSHTDLFAEALCYADLYRCVYRYLWAQARQRHSPFVRLARGCYAIKPNIAVQLDLFVDLNTEDSTTRRPRKARAESRQLWLPFE